MFRNKLASWTLASALALATVNYTPRIVALNVMSHTGYREGDLSTLLKEPSTYLTRAEYKGFKALNLDTSQSEERDPHTYEADPFNEHEGSLHNLDLNAVFLGLQRNSLPKSPDKPTRLTGSENTTFYSIKDFVQRPGNLVGTRLLSEDNYNRIMNLEEGEVINANELEGFSFPGRVFTNIDLGHYTLSFGRDEKGVYTSLYDVWDFNPDAGYFAESGRDKVLDLGAKVLTMIGKPIHFYDRFYWDEYKDDWGWLDNYSF